MPEINDETAEAVNREYPKMIYRGDEQRIVTDKEEFDAALKDGFRTYDQLQALDRDGDGKAGGAVKKPA